MKRVINSVRTAYFDRTTTGGLPGILGIRQVGLFPRSSEENAQRFERTCTVVWPVYLNPTSPRNKQCSRHRLPHRIEESGTGCRVK
jgi:hypothetical protein